MTELLDLTLLAPDIQIFPSLDKLRQHWCQNAPRLQSAGARWYRRGKGSAFECPFAGALFRGILQDTMRTIRRYSNRKLYDTQDSHYVTLAQIAAIIRAGDEIQVLHKVTGGDLTAATLAQIIFEEEKRGPKLGVAGLRKIIQTGQLS